MAAADVTSESWRGLLGRVARVWTGAVCSVLVLTGCDDAPAPPTTVVVNTPPADGGQMVLLTVMVGAAFLALLTAVVFAWAWAAERRVRRDAERARREAEDAVLALTGQPIARVRVELLGRHPVSSPSARPGERPAPSHGGREIEGWHP